MRPAQFRFQSIAKPEEGFHSLKEDAVWVEQMIGLFGISDGAGGTGVCADRWANYLLENLPDAAIEDFGTFKEWQNGIWETYFDETANYLKSNSPDALSKFYHEGSSATLAVVWEREEYLKAITFGDAVCLHFSGNTRRLEHANIRLPDFLNNPFLLNCKEEPLSNGFWNEAIAPEKDDVLILASDAIGCFLLGLYALFHQGEADLSDDIQKVLKSPYRQANMLENQEQGISRNPETTWASIMEGFWEALETEGNFRAYTDLYLKENALALDDYSAIMLRFQE